VFGEVVWQSNWGCRCARCSISLPRAATALGLCTGKAGQPHCARASSQDLDVENCMFTIIDQLLDRLDLHPPMPADLREVLRRCAQDRLRVGTLSGARLRRHRKMHRFPRPRLAWAGSTPSAPLTCC
jgi:hypothetical protein